MLSEEIKNRAFMAYLYDGNVQKGAVHSDGKRDEQHDHRAYEEL